MFSIDSTEFDSNLRAARPPEPPAAEPPARPYKDASYIDAGYIDAGYINFSTTTIDILYRMVRW